MACITSSVAFSREAGMFHSRCAMLTILAVMPAVSPIVGPCCIGTPIDTAGRQSYLSAVLKGIFDIREPQTGPGDTEGSAYIALRNYCSLPWDLRL